MSPMIPQGYQMRPATPGVTHFARPTTFAMNGAGAMLTPAVAVLAEYDAAADVGALSIMLVDMNLINGVAIDPGDLIQAKIDFGVDGVQASIVVDVGHGLTLTVPGNFARVSALYSHTGAPATLTHQVAAAISNVVLSSRGEAIVSSVLTRFSPGVLVSNAVAVKPFADAFRVACLNEGISYELHQYRTDGATMCAKWQGVSCLENAWIPLVSNVGFVTLYNTGADDIDASILQRIAL